MAKKKNNNTKEEDFKDLLENTMQEIINDTSEDGVTLFNQHRLLREKASRNLLVCKQHEREKIEKGFVWVQIDKKTTVLRKVK